MLYNYIMIALVILDITLLVLIGCIKGKKYGIKALSHSKDATSDTFLLIAGICEEWYMSSKIWTCLYYSFCILALASNTITIYIASSNAIRPIDITLYSIISMLCTVITLALKCDTKVAANRFAYTKMKVALLRYNVGIISEAELLSCFEDCEKKISELYL